MTGFLAVIISFIIGGSALLGGFTAPGQQVTPINVHSCYGVELGTTINIDPNYLEKPGCQTLIGGRTYFRVRQQVKIITAKIHEGEYHNGDCVESYTGSLRKIGELPTGEDIYWESENYKHEDLKDFLLINTKTDADYYYFDVYYDLQVYNNNGQELPEFIKNCKETGGLVPVVGGPAAPVFPPQAISLTDIDFNSDNNQNFLTQDPNTGDDYIDNYNAHVGEYKFYYIYITKQNKPDIASQIGVLIKEGTSERRIYNVFYHAGTIYLLDQNLTRDDNNYLYNGSDTKPPLSVARNPSLQLARLSFITTSEWTWATPECKPALYFYPKSQVTMSLKVKPKGKITRSNPEHGVRGWQNFRVEPSGMITHKDKQYRYLYYETKLEKIKKPKEGFVVSQNDLPQFLDKLLVRLGLNNKEKEDFLNYWLKSLNKDPYYFIGLISQEQLEELEPFEYSVKPDQIIRVRLFFEGLQVPFSPQQPSLPVKVQREGFVMVDWGGILTSGTCLPDELSWQIVR